MAVLPSATNAFHFLTPIRDYVIRSINKDLPYNTFVMQQIAADQLGLDDNDPALAALGFLTVGLQFRSVHDRIDDQIDVVSRGLMGMTVACARCHDHKFDEIPTTDYYALYSTLASSEKPDELPVLGQPEPSNQLQDYEEKLNHRKSYLSRHGTRSSRSDEESDSKSGWDVP